MNKLKLIQTTKFNNYIRFMFERECVYAGNDK